MHKDKTKPIFWNRWGLVEMTKKTPFFKYSRKNIPVKRSGIIKALLPFRSEKLELAADHSWDHFGNRPSRCSGVIDRHGETIQLLENRLKIIRGQNNLI